MVKHVATGSLSFMGHLVVETRRHAVYVDGLTDAEAGDVGRAVRAAAAALRAEFDPLFVHSAVAGLRHEHFHQHVFVRHRGTPYDCPGTLPRNGRTRHEPDQTAVEELCVRLRHHPAWDKSASPNARR